MPTFRAPVLFAKIIAIPQSITYTFFPRIVILPFKYFFSLYLLRWQRIPSGKQSFPVPLSGSLPQSVGKIESLPVAWGRCVPSSLNREPPNICLKKPWNGRVSGRKKFSRARKNWASEPPINRTPTTKNTVNSFIFSLPLCYGFFQSFLPPLLTLASSRTNLSLGFVDQTFQDVNPCVPVFDTGKIKSASLSSISSTTSHTVSHLTTEVLGEGDF